ncbi:MAG: hypothetical protein ABWY82_00625, partial [Tardiphaga sp.]
SDQIETDAASYIGLLDRLYMNDISRTSDLQFAAKSLKSQPQGKTLNHRVPGSSPGAPTTPKVLRHKGF